MNITSSIEPERKLFEDDSEADKVWKSQHSLAEFTAPTNFKSYDELKKRLDVVLSGTTTVGNVTEMTTSFDDSPEVSVVVDTKEEPAPTITVSEDDDDTMSYFEKLAEEG